MVVRRIGGPTPPLPTPKSASHNSSGGGATTTSSTAKPAQPAPPPPPPSRTKLSSVIADLVAAMNSPPHVLINPVLGSHFVGWRPWDLLNQWGSNALLRQYLDLLRQQAVIRQQILGEVARMAGLPAASVVITQQEEARPIGLRVSYIQY